MTNRFDSRVRLPASTVTQSASRRPAPAAGSPPRSACPKDASDPVMVVIAEKRARRPLIVRKPRDNAYYRSCAYLVTRGLFPPGALLVDPGGVDGG